MKVSIAIMPTGIKLHSIFQQVFVDLLLCHQYSSRCGNVTDKSK